jgi:hypothetical protein
LKLFFSSDNVASENGAKETRDDEAHSSPGQKEICEPITDLIADYLNDGLSRPKKRKFEEHLSICPDCVAFLKTYKKTIQLTKSFLSSVPSGKASP